MFDSSNRLGRGKALVAIIAFVLAVGLVACGGDDDEGSDTNGGSDGPVAVRGAIIPTATHLPVMVAEDEGFFENNGVDMEVTVIQNLATLPGAMGRQFDFGSTTIPDVIKARQQGIDISVVSGLARESEAQPTVAVLGGPQVSSPQDLVGKTMGVITLGGNIHIATLKWLMDQGIDPDDINFVEVAPPNQPDQLANGDIDAAENLEPFRSIMLEAGANDIVDPMLEIANPVDLVNWMTSTEWASENSETVDNVVTALNEAIAFIDENPDRSREILAEYSGLPPEAAASLRLPEFGTDVDSDLVAAWAGALESIGELQGSADEVSADEVLMISSQAE